MERAVVDEAKIAEHSRYVCIGCRTKIKKGLPVLRKGETTKFGYQSHSFCHRCAERQFKYSKDTIEQMKKTIDETEKKYNDFKASSTKALVLEALEYKEEQNRQRLENQKSNDEWEARQKQWDKEREERDKEFEEFKKYKEKAQRT